MRELQASVGRNKRQQTNIKKKDKMPTLRKIKRGVLPTHLPTQNTTFYFAQPHQKPTHHPTHGRLTIWRKLLTETELKNLTLRTHKLTTENKK